MDCKIDPNRRREYSVVLIPDRRAWTKAFASHLARPSGRLESTCSSSTVAAGASRHGGSRVRGPRMERVEGRGAGRWGGG